MSRERGTGIASIVIAVIAIILTTRLPESTMAGDVGNRVFPYLAAGIMLVTGILMVMTGGKEKDKEKQEPHMTGKQWLRLAIVPGSLLLYAFLMTKLGFIIPSIAVLFVFSTLFSKGEKVALWKRVLFAVVIPLVIFILFNNILVMRMPMWIPEKWIDGLF